MTGDQGTTPHDLTAFCEREYPRLVGALDLYCGDRAVAEEVAQEALLRACRDWPKVSAMSSPGGWTHRVAVNLATSHFRRRQAERRATDRLAARPEPEDGAADTADVLAVRAAIARLPGKSRMVVIQRYYLDRSVAETAEVMGIPVGTVKSLAARALPLLRAGLGGEVVHGR